MGFQNYPSKARLLYAILTLMGVALCLMVLHSTTSYTVILTGESESQSSHLVLGPGSEQYTIYVSNLQTCLDASNLTHHFRQEDLLTTAVTNVKYYIDVLRKFIPHQFNTTLPNHCWNADVKLDISSSVFSGYFNGTEFSVSRRDIKENELRLLNTLPDSAHKTYTRHHLLPLSCIPEVFLVGFKKCGSCYLHCLITSHPAVSRAIRKEANFFSKISYFNTENRNALYFADYITNFESSIQDESGLSVDGTVGMITRWPVFVGQQNIINYCLLPSVIPEILPKAKFIVVMREPLSMLYSLFWFSCTLRRPVPSRETQLKGPDIFHERIVARVRHFKSCLTVFPLAKCIAESSTIREPFHPLMPRCGKTLIFRAIYYIHIQKWLSVIPRERFLFLTLEELSNNLDQTADMVWKFIGVKPFAINHHNKCGGKNKQKKVDYKNDPHLAMRNDTREIMESFFQPYNKKLAELLGDRKFLWNQTEYYD